MDIEKIQVVATKAQPLNPVDRNSPTSKEKAAEHLMKTCKAGKVDSLADKANVVVQPKANPFQTFFRIAQVGDAKAEKKVLPPSGETKDASRDKTTKGLNGIAAKFKPQVVEGKLKMTAAAADHDGGPKVAPVECVLSDTKEAVKSQTGLKKCPATVESDESEKPASSERNHEIEDKTAAPGLRSDSKENSPSPPPESGSKPAVLPIPSAATPLTISQGECTVPASTTEKKSSKSKTSPVSSGSQSSSAAAAEAVAATIKVASVEKPKKSPAKVAAQAPEKIAPASVPEKADEAAARLEPASQKPASSVLGSEKSSVGAATAAIKRKLPSGSASCQSKRRATENDLAKMRADVEQIVIPDSREIAGIVEELKKQIEIAKKMAETSQKALEKLSGVIAKTELCRRSSAKPKEINIHAELYEVINGLLVPPVTQIVIDNQIFLNEHTISYDISLESPTLSITIFCVKGETLPSRKKTRESKQNRAKI